MEQYIKKSAVENILRNLWQTDNVKNSEHRICYNKALQEVQCELDTLEVKEVVENSFDSHIQEGDKITVNENGSRFNRSQLERVIAAQKYANQMEERVGCGIEFTTNEIEDAFLAGMIEGQKRMTKQVIERDVKVDAGGYPYIDATELYDYDNDKPLAKTGDKVKVLIVKE